MPQHEQQMDAELARRKQAEEDKRSAAVIAIRDALAKHKTTPKDLIDKMKKFKKMSEDKRNANDDTDIPDSTKRATDEEGDDTKKKTKKEVKEEAKKEIKEEVKQELKKEAKKEEIIDGPSPFRLVVPEIKKEEVKEEEKRGRGRPRKEVPVQKDQINKEKPKGEPPKKKPQSEAPDEGENMELDQSTEIEHYKKQTAKYLLKQLQVRGFLLKDLPKSQPSLVWKIHKLIKEDRWV